jgi:hypothetical protein
MPLRLFGAGSIRVRSCPACERKVKADATFCPSCYMVFRPEGAAALREYLQGARVPADVYLLRKMQTEDPNAGPVTCAAPDQTDVRKAIPAETPPTPPVEATGSSPSSSARQLAQADPVVTTVPTPLAPKEGPESRDGQKDRFRMKMRNGVEGFLAFVTPLPPPAQSTDELPALYAWMLEKDPVIPNNLARLQEIHAEVFRNKAAARLGYEQHLLLQVAEDLSVYTTEDALGFHLAQLAAAYRRAADAYRKAETDGSAVHHPLWQMASLATRMRLEAWVYHARHGESPQLLSTRQRELPLKFPRH